MHFYCLDWMTDSSGRELLISGAADKRVLVWDPDRMDTVRKLSGHTETINCVAASPDGERIASCGNDDTVRLYLADDEQVVLTGHTDEVNIVAWSPSGKRLASCGNDALTIVWDAETGREVFRDDGHGSVVNSVAWSPDGRLLATGGDDGTVRVFSAETLQLVGTLRGLDGHAQWVGFDASGKLLAARSNQRGVLLWRTDTWDVVSVLPETTSQIVIPMLAFHPHRTTLCTLGERDMAVRIWDLDPDLLLDARRQLLETAPSAKPSYKMVSSAYLDALQVLWPFGKPENRRN